MTVSSAEPTATTAVRTDDPIRVIMADDDRNDHLLLMMAAEGAHVPAEFEFVDDGSDLLIRLAQVACPEELPDIIVLDLRMPGIDGHRTLELLQEHPVLWQVPVVVFTSSTRRTDEVRSFDRGARWVDVKPSDFDGMMDFARRLVERARSHRESRCYDLDPALDRLRADTIADTEDELLFRIPELSAAGLCPTPTTRARSA